MLPVLAAALGVMVQAAAALASRWMPTPHPPWSSFAGVDTALPVLSALSEGFRDFLLAGLVLAFFMAAVHHWSGGWRMRKGRFIALTLLLGVIMAALTGDTLPAMAVQALVTGPLLLAAYVFVLRHDVPAVVFTLAALMILRELVFTIHASYPHAMLRGGVSMVLIAVGAWLLYNWLGGRSRTRTAP